jgi:hypothetical protein
MSLGVTEWNSTVRGTPQKARPIGSDRPIAMPGDNPSTQEYADRAAVAVIRRGRKLQGRTNQIAEV